MTMMTELMPGRLANTPPDDGDDPAASSGSAAGPSGPAGPTLRPASVAGVLAAGWAAIAGMLVCSALAVIGWFATDGGTAGQAVRVGVGGWLLAHLVPVELGERSTVSLAPLGLTVVAALVLLRAGRWAADTSVLRRARDVALGAGVLALSYGAFAAAAAALARSGQTGPQPVRAFFTAGLIALCCGGAGMARSARLSRQVRKVVRRLPIEVQSALAGGLAGLGALLAAGAVLVLIGLVAHGGRALDLLGSLRAGPIGGALVVLACVAYLPNAAIYAAAYTLGPGFALGTGTVVAPTGVVLGALPTFPLLAAVPTAEPPSAWLMSVFLLPLVAGAYGGVVAVRRSARFAATAESDDGTTSVPRLEVVALRGALAGAVAGIGCYLCILLADGAAGPDRMARFGPDPLVCGLVAVLTFVIAGAVAATVDHVRVHWRRQPDDDPADHEDAATERP
jgi:hypothetical protein